MTDIIIQGIYGRMGRALVEKIGAREDCRIVAGVDREAGRIGEIPVYAGFDALPCKGVIIDFSSPAGAVAAAQYGAANGLPCVICSTGLSREDEAALEAASTRTPIFRSANMSVGVNVLIELARQATKILGGEFDIEIIEKHHHNKLDAPSGTALMIADAINTEANAGSPEARRTGVGHQLHPRRRHCGRARCAVLRPRRGRDAEPQRGQPRRLCRRCRTGSALYCCAGPRLLHDDRPAAR